MSSTNKRLIFPALTLTILCFAPLSGEIPLPPLKGKVILLDPGHGTINYEMRIINPGKENILGHKEHNLTVKISQYLGKLLEKEGAEVIYTRTPHDYWRESCNTAEDNKARAYFANNIKADAFISIHCDWHPRSRVNGVTTFYLKKNSRRLGELVHNSMVKNLKAFNRKLVNDSYTVLDIAEVPAILVETGFLSNRNEARKLGSSKYQQSVASAIAKGIQRYFTEGS